MVRVIINGVPEASDKAQCAVFIRCEEVPLIASFVIFIYADIFVPCFEIKENCDLESIKSSSAFVDEIGGTSKNVSNKNTNDEESPSIGRKKS